MSPLARALIFATLPLAVALALFVMLKGGAVAVLQPHGLIGHSEKSLIADTFVLMMIPILAIFGLTFFFAYWYREGNDRAKYSPKWEHGALNELVWWAIPLEIILVLGALTWTSSHELDPRRAITEAPAYHIQVIALPWKWLFIYPEESIATVNFVRFPAGRDIEFDITADAPMNSFWIPQLGGQIYAMTGMMTTLHLIADTEGTYRGLSANYSGEGFEKMKFSADAVSEEEFAQWVDRIRASGGSPLTMAVFTGLAKESTVEEPLYFSDTESGLFEKVISLFSPAGAAMGNTHNE